MHQLLITLDSTSTRFVSINDNLGIILRKTETRICSVISWHFIPHTSEQDYFTEPWSQCYKSFASVSTHMDGAA